MSKMKILLDDRTLDLLICDLSSLQKHIELPKEGSTYLDGDYKAILRNPTSQALFEKLSQTISLPREKQGAIFQDGDFSSETAIFLVLISGLAAFNAFLQANVTGPPLEFGDVFSTQGNYELREQCLKSLDVDGVSVYQHIPHVELFCLARIVFTVYFPRIINTDFRDCKWMRVRINAYHQRLLSGMSGGRLSDSSALQDVIQKDLKELEGEVLGPESKYSTEGKVQFLLEKAQIYIMQGLDLKANENVKLAKTVSGFSYALSGALGKRTKFQQTDISQLVVFAKSSEDGSRDENLSSALKNSKISKGTGNVPNALELNDDTLLENIEFTKNASDKVDNSALPPELVGMQPDDQPQLKPLDQITLLTEATLKDTFSPLDKLNSEEILPYAIRVLSDKPTNWQIYTQALLVRSRIESHRSRTLERSVLQLQVIVDQIIASTTSSPSPNNLDSIPEIKITSFLPAPKPTESAPVTERLQYIYQLNTPTRWELETELAYAWSGAGSLISALEIFKRLKLWAEVALCYHSVSQEDKARQIIRRQLFYSSKGKEMDDYDIDASELLNENWEGEMRPTPPHAPRLWCILGDLDADPACWERAWSISKNRYARAQRSLGEYYTKASELDKAREAYMKATVVNRQNGDTWSRLGDLDLRVGNWDGAVVAFQQAIMLDDTDAKTYSNLGSALLSKHAELISLQKVDTAIERGDDSDEEPVSGAGKDRREDPKEVLRQALIAYKRGASLSHSTWQIWDNVITIAARMSPPSYPDLVLGLRNVIRIRAPSIGEAAIDVDILRALISEVTSRERIGGEVVNGIWTPPRGSLGRVVCEVVSNEIEPLITDRWELYSLIEKLAFWRRDYKGALEAAEKAWRGATKGEGWLEKEEAWQAVVAVTGDLVSALENYGGMEVVNAEGGEELVEKAWKSKARSAVRGIMGKARDVWEETPEWEVLKGRLEELKGSG